MAVDVYEALVELFTAQGWDQVYGNGLITGTEPPGTNFPYAMLDPLSRSKVAASNRTNYWRPTVTITVYDKTFDLVKNEIAAVVDGLEDAPLLMNGAEVNLYCNPTSVHHQQEDQYWKASVDVEITVARRRPGR